MSANLPSALAALSLDDLSFAISSCERELHADRELLKLLGDDASTEFQERIEANIAAYTARAARFRQAYFAVFGRSMDVAS